MAANETEGSRLEQKSIIKFVLTENCKPYEIYRRICDVYGEICFSQKNVYRWAKDGFAITCLSRKDRP